MLVLKLCFCVEYQSGYLVFLRLMAEQIPDPETVENKRTVHAGVQKYAVVEGTWKNR